MKLIVGLGNPGEKYNNTRHNVGFMVLDNYINTDSWKEKNNALFIKKNIGKEEVIFIKPTTFMNLSGDSVIKYVNYYKINITDILIIQDDLDMQFGTYKLKKDTSSGGHNGIKSIESVLKTNSFARLKIGIKTSKEIDVIDFVLSKFSKEEKEEIFKTDYNKIIDMFIKEGFEKTINSYKN